MPQHLWNTVSIFRFGEVCSARQFGKDDDWKPRVSPICSGDPDEDGRRRTTRPKPVAPFGAPRVLELA
jgi:hypothetical protein